MKFLKPLGILLLSVLLFIACEKEYSEEGGGTAVAVGTLKSDVTGECLPSSIGGVFKAGTNLTSTNYVDVTLDFSTTGTFLIRSDTVNGYHFRGVGMANTVGVTTVRLIGVGKPVNAGTNTITVKYGTSSCSIVLDVLSAGTGTAVFTPGLSGTNCGTATLAGTYVAGTAVTASNTVTVGVNVTTAGTYNVTIPAVNGISFSGSGVFAATGPQNITLVASGTPTTAGTSTHPFTGSAGSTCSFAVVTTAGGGGTPTDFITAKVNGVLTTFNVATDAEIDNSLGFPALLIIGDQNTTATSPYITLGVAKAVGGPITAATYTVNQSAQGIAVGGYYIDAAGAEFSEETDIAGATRTPGFTVVISAITATRVTGTFFGTLKQDGTGPAVKTITEGAFSLPLP